MKELETKFVANCDKSGNQVFHQIRREGHVYLYQRETLEGKPMGFEVFVAKMVKTGASLPGGGTVTEDYVQYPGKSAFGRSAWFVGGSNAEKRANERFNALTKNEATVVEAEEETETDAVPVARVVKGEVTLKLPDKPFTQRDLASYNGLENYKEVYSDLQKMLKSGMLKVVGERTAGRGKSAKLFFTP